jgi:hypothetical protein
MKIFGIKKSNKIFGLCEFFENEIEFLFIDPKYFGKV